MDTVVKAPSECTSAELDAFQKLAEEGEQVLPDGLRQRIEQAAALVFVNESECIAVGAIKNPNLSYKKRVFTKADVPDKNNNYKYELGWLYVTPAARRKGLGNNLMQALVSFLGDSGCYATTREDNKVMHSLFSKYNFSRLGTAYQNDKGDSFVLYANKP